MAVAERAFQIWPIIVLSTSKGFINLNTSQEITNKLAAWCISWWDMVKIVKPAKLKKFIREMRTSFSKINK